MRDKGNVKWCVFCGAVKYATACGKTRWSYPFRTKHPPIYEAMSKRTTRPARRKKVKAYTYTAVDPQDEYKVALDSYDGLELVQYAEELDELVTAIIDEEDEL